MGGSDHDFSRLDSKIPKELELENQASKRRKVVEKTVVAVKIEASDHGRQKTSEDCWSWRKYGQKPIKGSPFPRGYYKCSTSKGCSAKKQVERCKTDSSMLIITYTSTHNHPDHPNDLPPTDLTQQTKEPQTQTIINIIEQEEQDHEPADEESHDHTMTSQHFHYSQSPFNSSDDQDMIISSNQDLESMTYEPPNVFFDEQPPITCSHELITSFSTVPESSEENDFYDELEELPTSSFFMRRTNFFDERILIHPS